MLTVPTTIFIDRCDSGCDGFSIFDLATKRGPVVDRRKIAEVLLFEELPHQAG